MKCEVCKQPFGKGEYSRRSRFAALGGLPEGSCGYCFAENDFSVKDATHLQARSILRRHNSGEEITNVDGVSARLPEDNVRAWSLLLESFEG